MTPCNRQDDDQIVINESLHSQENSDINPEVIDLENRANKVHQGKYNDQDLEEIEENQGKENLEDSSSNSSQIERMQFKDKDNEGLGDMEKEMPLKKVGHRYQRKGNKMRKFQRKMIS